MNVWDFDNTIYDGESGMSMLRFFLRRKPSLLRHLPRVALGVVRYKTGRLQAEKVAEQVGDLLAIFLTKAGSGDTAADMREFWDAHEHRIRPLYRQLQQPDDVIVSAGPEQSLREICGRLGVKHYMGSMVNEQTKRLDFVCYRDNKVKAFRARFPDAVIENFYSDSMDDKPMMDIAQRVFLVEKSKLRQIK
jgi:phosphoserine phosphatase